MAEGRRRLTAALFGDEEREAPVAQSANCTRCGETLEFHTNGMGRVVEWCPCCHGGQRRREKRVPVPIVEPKRSLWEDARQLRGRQ